jgi:acetyl esterase/lipase
LPFLKFLTPWVLISLLALAALTACSPTDTLNALASRGTHTFTDGVAYGPLARQKLDIYQPASAAPAGGWPTVVFFYGGSWNSGERASYKFVAEALAARGVLTLVADYRLYPEVRFPDFLNDTALALAFGFSESARLGGNPKRVFVMGHSAGAYNAAMLALDPRWLAPTGHTPAELAGWIGLAGPYDFLPMTNVAAQPVFFHPNYPPGTQPLQHAGANAPRSFLGAPIEDSLVNPQRSTVGLASKLQAANVPVTLKLYERVGHTLLAGAFAAPLRWLAPVRDDVVAFIEATPARP